VRTPLRHVHGHDTRTTSGRASLLASPLEDLVTRTLQSLLLLALPAGGQATARRNAWAGMSADAARGRDRRQAEAALAAADVRAYGGLGAHG
jgi:hypothetical protein